MKTRNILRQGLVTLLCTAVFAGFAACSTDPVEREGGKLPDKETIETTYGMLRSGISTGNVIDVLLTANRGDLLREFYFEQTRPATEGATLTLRVDESLVDAYNAETGDSRTLLPAENYEFPDGQTLELAASDQRTTSKRIRFMSGNLAAGEYVLPITIAEEGSTADNQTLYYLISVREPYVGQYELHDGSDLFFVLYVNTRDYQPLLVQDYLLRKWLLLGGDLWTKTIGNIINLRTVTVKYDDSTGRAMLDLGSDMTYVLGHASKYIWPLQEEGRKVCLSLEGGGTGLGFCNMTDAQIADFVAQVKAVVETYNLDGINLWDRNTGYGKEGMPEMNTTSYPKLVKAMRDALGTEKLLTLTVYEEPTSTFWDTEATGGIAVGEYLDYAWSGYNSKDEAVQLLDPWHPDESYVSAYTQKPIAGLDPSQFGCINFPIYPGAKDSEEMQWRSPTFIKDWVNAGYQPNRLIIFDDIRAHLQDEYETQWDQFFASFCQYMDPGSQQYAGILNGCWYTFQKDMIAILPNGGLGYGKWLKDW